MGSPLGNGFSRELRKRGDAIICTPELANGQFKAGQHPEGSKVTAAPGGRTPGRHYIGGLPSARTMDGPPYFHKPRILGVGSSCSLGLVKMVRLYLVRWRRGSREVTVLAECANKLAHPSFNCALARSEVEHLICALPLASSQG